MGRGTHRGFITHEELNKSLGKRNLSDENLAQAFIHILDENISLVEKKSDFKVLRKKEKSSKDEGKTIEKSDDPIRMYLREMGGVELLSREGEIAIAKRIEAGKDVMLIALSQSPITAQQFFEWDVKLQKDEILVREIIDIDTNYMEDESTGPSAKQKNNGEADKDEVTSEDGDDDFNPTLAAMETEIKPKVLKTVNILTKEYNKLIKYQKDKLDCILNSRIFSPSKEKSYEKIVNGILENIKSLQLSPSVLEELVQKHYVENKKIVSLEGNLLRLAMLVAGKEIENYIQKLSQMARAAGIHIIMATQRPSVDVITGTIKANFPTRISFQVTSKIDSRTILGEQGAEQLLGKGDMLYMSSANKIIRIHAPFVSDNEIEKINNFLRSQAEPDYVDEILNFADEKEMNEGSKNQGDKDELYQSALDIIKSEGKASTSFLQRKLQIGYNRAARIIDMMEAEGIVSKANHVGKRDVL